MAAIAAEPVLGDDLAQYDDEGFEEAVYETEPDMTASEEVDAALAEIEAMDDDLPGEDEAYADDETDLNRLPN